MAYFWLLLDCGRSRRWWCMGIIANIWTTTWVKWIIATWTTTWVKWITARWTMTWAKWIIINPRQPPLNIVYDWSSVKQLTNLDTYFAKNRCFKVWQISHYNLYLSQALTNRTACHTFLVQCLQIGSSKDTSHVLRLRTAAIAPLLLRFFLLTPQNPNDQHQNFSYAKRHLFIANDYIDSQ